MLFTGGITSPIAENLRKTRLNFGKERIVHKIFIVEDDPVIARADGTVLYNFAVAVDDMDAVRADPALLDQPARPDAAGRPPAG